MKTGSSAAGPAANDPVNWLIPAKKNKDVSSEISLTAVSTLSLHTTRLHACIHTGKVLIVGAGWYGCHAAMTLTKLGIPFDMVDSTNSIMSESSTKNQNRLHLGFHYPRAYRTRHECVVGYEKFMSYYAHLTVDVKKNLYLVAKDSIIDYQTYCNIFAFEGTDFKDVATMERAGMPFSWMEDAYGGFMLTRERMIDCEATQAFFHQKLHKRLLPKYRTAALSISWDGVFCMGAQYTMALNCTYGQLESNPNVVFELSCSWVYRFVKPLNHLFGFTVMDGPFFSIYPYKPKDNLFTLTHVAWTPLMTSSNVLDIREAMDDAGTLALVERHHANAVAHVAETIPDFAKHFGYVGHFLSTKCKSRLRDDDRSLSVRENTCSVSFCGGKITGIFSMQQHLERMAQNGAFGDKTQTSPKGKQYKYNSGMYGKTSPQKFGGHV